MNRSTTRWTNSQAMLALQLACFLAFVPLALRSEVITIAHRGSSAEAPENTLAAIRLAVADGAEACEFDVYRTADGELVLFHDEELERTSDFATVFGGAGETRTKIEEFTLAELRRLDVGSWKDARFAGERIPTLAEALRAMRGAITPVIEIKPADIGRDVARVISEENAAGEVFVQSFEDKAIRDVRAELAGVPTGLLIGGEPEGSSTERARDFVRRAREAGASAVVCSHKHVDRDFAWAIRRRGMALWVYTVNDPKDMRRLEAHGVEGIITDEPALHLRVRFPPRELPTSTLAIAAGTTSVTELARAYASLRGLPLLSELDPERRRAAEIRIPAPMPDADAEIIRHLLEANGFRLRTKVLPNGRRSVVLADARATDSARALEPLPVVEETGRPPRPSRRPTAGLGAAPDAPSDVVKAFGIRWTSVPPALAAHLRLRAGAGAVVDAIDDDQRARLARALEPYDIVTTVGSTQIKGPTSLVDRLNAPRRAQERRELRVIRKGRTLIIPIRE